MPYINPNDRQFIDPTIALLIENMAEMDGSNGPLASGLVNYVITCVVTSTMKPPGGWSYTSLSRALAVFRDAEAEMRRRLLDPYEDKAIIKNGDVPEYAQP